MSIHGGAEGAQSEGQADKLTGRGEIMAWRSEVKSGDLYCRA